MTNNSRLSDDPVSFLVSHANSLGKTEIKHSFTVVKRNGSLVPFRRDRILNAIDAAFRDTKKIEKSESLPDDIAFIVNQVTDHVVEQLLLRASQGACLTVEGIQDMVEVSLMKMGHHDVARDYIIYRDSHKALREDSPQNLKIERADGSNARFNPMKIASAIEHAFRTSKHVEGPSSEQIIEAVNVITQKVVGKVVAIAKTGQLLHVAMIQDEIEQELMREGFFHVAKDFILQRASKGDLTNHLEEEKSPPNKDQRQFIIINQDGQKKFISEFDLHDRIRFACRDIEDVTSADSLLEESVKNFYEDMKESEVDQANIMAARAKIEVEPAYSKVAARLLLDTLYRETLGIAASDPSLESSHRKYLKEYIEHGIAIERISPALREFDLDKIAKAMQMARDDQFTYIGLQTLYDRYFIHENQKRLETPQIFWMRVAMGLALNEPLAERTDRAIEFYNVLSTFHFISSTPTLFNAGTNHSQLSSCFLSTVVDDLSHIFKVISDDAQLSKWAGGLGNDWTNVRATGSTIKGTNGKSQGVIPFLKVANDTAVAVNQGGKRKGAMCAYLETWHLDIEDFLELRKNTGDERRRTHDMNTANWIPDLFMKRVAENGRWTLFSPSDTSDLHDLYGAAFEARYTEYEKMADEGKLKLYKKIEALQLWRKMLSMLFETGHPWITFKDPSNIRSPQDHMGVVHSSNLCTEILLNTSMSETAVCNLGSVNLSMHITDQKLDEKKLAATIKTAIRMLDNVIDINFYPIPETRNANLQHRPIGLGLMGFQDALYMQNISYASYEAVQFSSTMNWDLVRESIKKYGMRNSNTMAIAPTATISNITGVTQSIEPTYKHLYVKSNLSGEFTTPNIFLVERLKQLNLWDAEMIDDLKYFDGSISEIDRIPSDVKEVFLTAFEVAPDWLIECASRRQKWIDMGQSLNLYLYEPSGKKLHEMYMLAWTKGLKTTYYLRTLAATQIEKSTTDINKRGLQPRWMKSKSASSNIQVSRSPSDIEVDKPKKDRPLACNLEEGCESCQ
ncbi:MAG: ribonucleoside-diphosphate reductase subunit alpha [Chlamydiia bacterium]|nr:ribonucleoside-diphosphate reductase subunit alpha [Chlamydiia bacterium]